MAIGIIGMLVAIAVMIIGAYRGIKAIPLTVLAAIFVILFNRMGVWDSYSKVYAVGFGNVVASYFFNFCASAAYAMIMEKTGCTASIGFQLTKWFGTKSVIVVSYIITMILTYGGISLFVVVFAVAPIAYVLFKEADLPRHAIMAPLSAGAAGITMTTLPATPQLTNIVPSQYLGTPLTAAPVFSLVLAAIMVALHLVYFNIIEKRCRAKTEHFAFPPGFDAATVNVDRAQLPSSAKAFAPMVLVVLFIIVCTILKAPIAKDSAELTTIAMILAGILCLVLNPRKITVTSVKNWIGDGANNGISGIIGLAAVVAFGGVVSSAPAFQSIIQWLLNLKLSVYLKGVVSTAVIAGITGSSSGGARILLQNLGEYFVNSGANLQVLHRLISVAAGSLDTLPHVSGVFLMLTVLGLTHKEGYYHMFWTTVVIPLIVSFIGLTIAVILW
jgi:H+/gluconate symporter-like permease